MSTVNYFYHEHIRKAIVAFGSLFNDVYIKRKNSQGTVVAIEKVPLAYGPKQKFLVRVLENNPEADPTSVAITLPRMGFEMTGLTYDATRKMNTFNLTKVTDPDNPSTMKKVYNAVPYNLEISLFVLVKTQEDGLQIVEQILPFFTPAYTVTSNVVPEMSIKDDIPIILNNISYEDDYEGEYAARRSVIWTLSFTMKLNFYGKVNNQGIIKKVTANTINIDTNKDLQTYVVEPNPTSSDADDDFGFTETITEY